MITTLALELVALLLSFFVGGAETVRRFESSCPVPPVRQSCRKGKPGGLQTSLLTEKDNQMMLYFSCDETRTLFEVSGSYNLALGFPDLPEGAEVTRIVRDDFRDRRRLPGWKIIALAATRPVVEGRQP